MPVMRTFKGQAVVRIRRTADGRVELKMANSRPGDRHTVQIVTQQEWQRYGDEEFKEALPDLRQLAQRPA